MTGTGSYLMVTQEDVLVHTRALKPCLLGWSDRLVYTAPTDMAAHKTSLDTVTAALTADTYQLKDIHTLPPPLAAILLKYPDIPHLYQLRSSKIFRELWKTDTGPDVWSWPAPPAAFSARPVTEQSTILALFKHATWTGAAGTALRKAVNASGQWDPPCPPGTLWRKGIGKTKTKLLNAPQMAELQWLDCLCALLHGAPDAWGSGEGFHSRAGQAVLHAAQAANDAAHAPHADTKEVQSSEANGLKWTSFQQQQCPLSAEHVQHFWVPTTLTRWRQLIQSFRRRSITVHSLESTFGRLATPNQSLCETFEHELALLLADMPTRSSRSSSSRATDKQIQAGLSDFARLSQLRPQLLAFVHLFESLATEVATPPKTKSKKKSGSVNNEVFAIQLPPGRKEETIVSRLRATDARLRAEWHATGSARHTLATISGLLDPVRPVAAALNLQQAAFLACLGNNPTLVVWLRHFRDQDVFDNKLQVARGLGSITEPELVSGIESLKRVRVSLCSNLYVEQTHRYTSYIDFLTHFGRRVLVSRERLLDVHSLREVGDRLLEVLDKQTKGAGVKNCYDLVDIHTKGTFVLVASPNLEDVLYLTLKGKPSHGLDYLHDLRAKLMMTEISSELDEETAAEPGAKVGVKTLLVAFTKQVAVLERIRNQVHTLCLAGHFGFQRGKTVASVGFDDVSSVALRRLNDLYATNALELIRWTRVVKTAREARFYLNFYTMQELWILRTTIASVMALATATDQASMQPSKDASHAAPMRRRARALAKAASKFTTMLHLVSSSATITAKGVATLQSREVCDLVHAIVADVDPAAPGSTLDAIGRLLAILFVKTGSDVRPISALGEDVTNAADMLLTTRQIAGGSADSAGGGGSKGDPPGPNLTMDAQEDHPIWVATTTDVAQSGGTIDMVLSVFIRRGRLPEPGEIVFCSPDTSSEILELTLRRFIMARANGWGNSIFCLVNVDKLSYSKQVMLGRTLKSLLDHFGSEDAAGLFLLAGAPGQHIVNTLSAYQVMVYSLTPETLRQKCTEIFGSARPTMQTRCVRSTVNGGGKTHFILKAAANAQADATRGKVNYHCIGYRENTSPGTLLRRLNTALNAPTVKEGSPSHSFVVHLNVGHLVPQTVDTTLFQLLFVGTLSDQASSQIYYRDPRDTYFVEVANSPATFEALRVARFLPGFDAPLQIGKQFLETQLPQIVHTLSYTRAGKRKDSTPKVVLRENAMLLHVCKLLTAIDRGWFKQGESTYRETMNWAAMTITPSQCYDLVCRYCGLEVSTPESRTARTLREARRQTMDAVHEEGEDEEMERDEATWTIVMNFIKYLDTQFTGLEGHKGWQGFGQLVSSCGVTTLRGFRHQFLLLLLQTTCDFAKRAVPRGQQFIGSASQTAVFDKMKTWEDTDHPVAVILPRLDDPSRTQNFTLFALNRDHTAEFINRRVQEDVEQQLGIHLSKDWTVVPDHEARSTIRQLAGVITVQDLDRGDIFKQKYAIQEQRCEDCRVEKEIDAPPGYVMTVDNMAKMLSIFNRIVTRLPVIIMGETGCGKSSLIRQMCALIKAPMRTLNIHGGMGERAILDWMWARHKEFYQVGLHRSGGRFVVFLDEVNTCNSMALFKEIVCDRMLEGIALPDNFIVLAACNPYRRRTALADTVAHKNTAHNNKAVNADSIAMKDLVYCVFPLPESMMDHVYDFGALNAATERLYIRPKIERYLKHPTRLATARELYLAERSARTIELWAEMTDKARAPYQTRVDRMQWEARIRKDSFVWLYAELICTAQEFVRAQNGGERSAASLRDVDRCAKIFRWFGVHLASEFGESEGWTLEDFLNIQSIAHRHIRIAVILSIAYCYHARLDRTRREGLQHRLGQRRIELADAQSAELDVLDQRRAEAVVTADAAVDAADADAETTAAGNAVLDAETNRREREVIEGKALGWLELSAQSFAVEVERMQTHFVSQMKVGVGIARNEALRENLFMMLISVLNRIPIFVIGVPGSSKSLAMRLIQSNLRGPASANAFLRRLPSVEVFPYQCSPQSTSQGIEQVFGSAGRVAREAQNTVVVVLLDEVGLAEYSPHLPLKVLHKLLDEAPGQQALVGISNWALDPAKMNRAVHLFRPTPTAADLAVTASGIVEGESLRPYLKAMACAYHEVVEHQQHKYQGETQADFWGLREFYSLVQKINHDMLKLRAVGEPEDLNLQQFVHSIQRNFGGRPVDQESVIETFFQKLGHQLTELTRMPVLDLIRENLHAMQESRHLMILTKNNATTALSLLYDNGLVNHQNSEVVFGSDFPRDDSDLQIVLNLQRIKKCMAEGRTVVLVHSRNGFYETLYDLLNQNYTEHGGQLYARLAFGNSYVLCPLLKEFRVIVVVNQSDAYTKLASPLLNRFEKQVLTRQHLLVDDRRSQRVCDTVRRLGAFAHSFAKASFCSMQDVEESNGSREGNPGLLRGAFCGFHKDMLLSLVQSMPEPLSLPHAIRRLLWCATPEAASQWMTATNAAPRIRAEYGVDIEEIYFKEQHHSNLPTFVRAMLQVTAPRPPPLQNSATIVMTFAPPHHDTAALVDSACPDLQTRKLDLHQLSSEHDLQQELVAFLGDQLSPPPKEAHRLLIVHCDPVVTSAQRVEHAKYIVEQTLSAHPLDKATSSRRHILLLVHLPREMAGQIVPVDFNKRWRYAFVDAIDSSESNGMPDLPQLLEMNHNLHRVMEKLDFAKVFQAVFRSALASLKLPLPPGPAYYLHKIRILQSLLHTGTTEPSAFLVCAREIVQLVIQKAGLTLDLAITAKNELLLRGTFQNCLHAQIREIVRQSLVLVLAHAERNAALALVSPQYLAHVPTGDERAHLVELWYRLFHRSIGSELVSFVKRFEDRSPAHNTPSNASNLVVVKMDGQQSGVRFVSRFPFSYYIAHLIEPQRAKYLARFTTEPLLDLEGMLARQVRALHQLHLNGDRAQGDILPENMLERYHYDFVVMFVAHDEHLTVDVERVIIPLTRRVLRLATGSPCKQPSDFHIRFWKHGSRLAKYLRLLHAVPQENQQRVCDGFLATSLDGCLDDSVSDMCFLDLVLSELEQLAPGQPAVNSLASSEHWRQRLVAMEEDLVSLLDAALDYAAKGRDGARAARLCGRWERLSLLSVFLREITIPLTQQLGRHQAATMRSKLWTQLATEVGSTRSHALFVFVLELIQHAAAGTAPEHFLRQNVANCSSRFLDIYINEHVFASPIPSQTRAVQGMVPHALFQDVISLLSNASMTFGTSGGGNHGGAVVALPESSRVLLMATVLTLAESSAMAKVDAFLLVALPRALCAGRAEAWLDAPLCHCYTTVREGIIQRKYLDSPSAEPRLDRLLRLAQLFQRDHAHRIRANWTPRQVAGLGGVEVRALLDAIAMARVLYMQLAAQLVTNATLGDTVTSSKDKASEFLSILNECLAPVDKRAKDDADADHGGDAKRTKVGALRTRDAGGYLRSSYLQSLQLFLLKAIDRHAGLSVLRGILARPGVGGAPWCTFGLKKAKIAHPHFARWTMGSNLPKSNPTKTHPGLEQVDALLTVYLQSEADALDITRDFMEPAKALLGAIGSGLFAGALLLACFSKCYYLRAQDLNLVPHQTQTRVRALHACISLHGHDTLKLPPLIVRMVQKFTDLDLTTDPATDFFFVGPQSTTEQILRLRVMVHLVATTALGISTMESQSGCEDGGGGGTKKKPKMTMPTPQSAALVAFFSALLFNPASLEKSYFPQQPMDELYHMMNTMIFASTGRRGRWYYCRNGHPYCVDACGRPTIVQPCGECGVLTGGQHHNQLQYVGDWNYGVGPNRAFGDPLSERPPGSLTMDRDVDPALQGNTGFSRSSTPQDRSMPLYSLKKGTEGQVTLSNCAEPLRGISGRSCCGMRLFVHAALCVGATFGGPEWTKSAAVFCEPVEKDTLAFPSLFADRYLLDWNRLKLILGGMGADNVAILVHAALLKLGNLDLCMPLKYRTSMLSTRDARAVWEHALDEAILTPLLGPDTIDKELRALKASFDDENEHSVGLMLQERKLDSYDSGERARAAPTLFRFHEAFDMQRFEFAVEGQKDAYPLLHAFLTKPRELRGAKLLQDSLQWMRLLTTYYNRRVTAEKAASEVVIRDVLGTAGRGQLNWHHSWNQFQAAWRLELHLGVLIGCATTPKNVQMGEESPLALCMPADHESGLLPKALAIMMTRFHNHFVDLAAEHVAARTGCPLDKVEEISSKNFTHAHTLCSKKPSYDAAVEGLISWIQRYALRYTPQTGKLMYDLQGAERWLADEYFASCPKLKLELDSVVYLGESATSDALRKLRQNVAQVPLPPELKASIGRTVTSQTIAQSLVEELEQALVIMVDSVVATAVRGDIQLWSVLMLEPGIFQNVCLQHVDALHSLLTSYVHVGEFPGVNDRYKVQCACIRCSDFLVFNPIQWCSLDCDCLLC